MPNSMAALGAFLAAGAVGLLLFRRARVLRTLGEATFCAAAALVTAWLMEHALGQAWPEVRRFSTSWGYVLASTIVFTLVAYLDLRRFKNEPPSATSAPPAAPS